MKRYIIAGAMSLLGLMVKAQNMETLSLDVDDIGACGAYALDHITLKQGFKVEAGARFTAKLVHPNFSPAPCEPLGSAGTRSRAGNYVEVTTATVPIFDEHELSMFDRQKMRQQISYMDGLGRTVQTIDRQASPLGSDMVQNIMYEDVTGRVEYEYLPYVSQSSSGNQIPADVSKNNQRDFYTANFGGDQFGYSQVVYDNSPLNRVVEKSSPGEDWNLASGHTVKTEPVFNQVDVSQLSHKVRKFEKDANGKWEMNGYYSVNQTNEGGTTFFAHTLNGQKVTDEEGNVSINFVNAMGQVLLQRREMDGVGQWQDTYFCYDEYGRLALVIPPLSIDQQGVSSWHEDNDSDLVYKYTYDKKGRLVEKDLPDSAPEYFIYDDLDRPILSQTAYMRSTHSWKFTKFDVLGRPIQTGTYTDITYISRNSMQSHVDGLNQRLYEDFDGSINGYTSIHAFPSVSIEVETITFYDNYDVDKDGVDDYTFDQVSFYPIIRDNEAHFIPESRELIRHTRGLPTVAKTRVNDGLNQIFLVTTTFYDHKGRVIQVKGDNHLEGGDIVDTWYSFVDQPLHVLTRHTDKAGNLTKVTERFVYDEGGRLKEQYQRMDDDAPVLMLQNNYDELGQLKEKNLHQSVSQTQMESLMGPFPEESFYDKYDKVAGGSYWQSVDYQYNIKGWMTHINDAELGGGDNDVFGMELNYNKPLENLAGSQGATALYNGQISEVLWRSVDDSKPVRRYAFEYDKLGQLTTAKYGEKVTATDYSQNLDKYSMGVTEYDAQGNIVSLWRNGLYISEEGTSEHMGTIDDLTYLYSGNKLTNVSDVEQTTSLPQGMERMGFTGGTLPTGFSGFVYDGMGRLVKDNYKGLEMVYNDMNLVTEVKRGANESIKNTYDAAGIKLKQVVTTFDGTHTNVATTDYVGGFIYEGNLIQFMHTAEGRVLPPQTPGAGWTYEYNLKDHLGNTRVRFSDLDGNGLIDADVANSEVLQDDHYYPFGMSMNLSLSEKHSTSILEHRFKYNGKELVSALDLDWYDYGARMYNPVLGRWNAIDPLAEKYVSWSTYNYVGSDPIKRIDPDGRDWWDTVLGFTASVVDNASAGLINPREALQSYVSDPSDYNKGQDVGDAVSVLAATIETGTGAGMMNTGGGMVVVGLAAEAPSAGTSTVVVAAGGVMVAEGALLVTHGLMMGSNAASSLAAQKGRMDEAKETESGETGKIYEVPAEATESGKPYIGRTKQASPEKRGKGANDGRDRRKAEVIDTYDPAKEGQGAYKEQKAIENRGGIDKLDNKRNEVRPERMKELEKKYGG